MAINRFVGTYIGAASRQLSPITASSPSPYTFLELSSCSRLFHLSKWSSSGPSRSLLLLNELFLSLDPLLGRLSFFPNHPFFLALALAESLSFDPSLPCKLVWPGLLFLSSSPTSERTAWSALAWRSG